MLDASCVRGKDAFHNDVANNLADFASSSSLAHRLLPNVRYDGNKCATAIFQLAA